MKFGFRSTFKSLFNVKSWIGWETVSQNGSWIQGMFTSIIRRPKQSSIKETYDEACERYGYTPDFLINQENGFRKASLSYLGVFFVGLGYMGWLYYKQHRLAAGIMIPINFMLFSLFFRESFWLMQLRHKKLGMTLRDWISFVVLKNG